MKPKHYLKPVIETLESSEILEMIGPVQGYGGGAGGARGGMVTSPMTGGNGVMIPQAN
jgi:hypothetical protein